MIKLPSIFNRLIVRNSFWMALSLAARLVIQAFYFVIIARALGPEQYGAFISVQALVAIVAPFTNLGAPELLVKNVSRKPEAFNECFGNAIVVTTIFGAVGCLLLVAGAPFLLHESISVGLIILVSVSDLFFEKFIGTARKSFQAFEMLGWTGFIDASISAARLAAAVLAGLFFSRIDALQWGWMYLGSSVVVAFVAVFWAYRDFGSPRLSLARFRSEASEGFLFSLSMWGQNMYNLMDKVMLARLYSLDAAGVYSVAYRLVEITMVPVRAVLAAAYAKFFQHGEEGIRGSYKFASRICPLSTAYGLGVSVMIYFFAPIVPFFLGDEYIASVAVLRWMAPLPILKSLIYFGSDTLAGAGMQGSRSLLIILSAFCNFMANFWLIPLYSWKGAVWATLFSSSILVVGLWVTVFIHCREKNRISPVELVGEVGCVGRPD